MSKPVIAAISRTALAGGFEFALSCDLRIAEDGDYLIGLPEANRRLLPGTAGTQRLLRTIGTPAALMHILMGDPLPPREAERKGLARETVSGKALDRAQGARSCNGDCTAPIVIHAGIGCLHQAPRSQRYRDAAGTGTGTRTKSLLELVHHRTCTRAHAFYEEQNITSPSRSMVVKQGV